MKVEQIAKVCHETNRAYCKSLGDNSQKSWDDAPEWQKESAINGVKFHLENPKADASASHENWLKEKMAKGWVYGPEKNALKKTHPCCVSFDKLPKEQQAKDFIFRQLIHSLSADVSGNQKQKVFAKVTEEEAKEMATIMANQNAWRAVLNHALKESAQKEAQARIDSRNFWLRMYQKYSLDPHKIYSLNVAEREVVLSNQAQPVVAPKK